MADELDWHELAFEVYRSGWLEIRAWEGLLRDDIEYWIEELKEELLDLKQATIAEEQNRVWLHVREIYMLLAELRLRRKGD
ncbi:MAG TPA: hypothetical protein VGG19_17720 [Tepidisphaeraceae bacterium]